MLYVVLLLAYRVAIPVLESHLNGPGIKANVPLIRKHEEVSNVATFTMNF